MAPGLDELILQGFFVYFYYFCLVSISCFGVNLHGFAGTQKRLLAGS